MRAVDKRVVAATIAEVDPELARRYLAAHVEACLLVADRLRLGDDQPELKARTVALRREMAAIHEGLARLVRDDEDRAVAFEVRTGRKPLAGERFSAEDIEAAQQVRRLMEDER